MAGRLIQHWTPDDGKAIYRQGQGEGEEDAVHNVGDALVRATVISTPREIAVPKGTDRDIAKQEITE